MLKNWSNWLVLFLIQFVGWKFLFKNQNLVTFWYQNITVNYNKIVYSISSKIDFALGEIVYLLFSLGLLFFIVKVFKLRTYSEKFSMIFKGLFIVLFLYNSIWGIVNYKKNFDNNIVKDKIEINVLKELYFNNLNNSILSRNMINSPKEKPIEFIYNNEIYLKDIQKGLEKLNSEKWIFNFVQPKKIIIKESNISLLLSNFGILGYYNPFTVESNINRKNSDLKSPFTISHELAHQMGFATENEANFIAYYLGVNSSIKEVQYAAYYKTTFSLLNAIYPQDSIFVKNELEKLPKGIKIDRDAEIEYYKQFDGKLNTMFSSLNNQFLKANNQAGIVSYSKYIELVYHYYLLQNKKASRND